MRTLILASLVFLAAGCTIAQRPDFNKKWIIRGNGAIAIQRVNNFNTGTYDLSTETMKFLSPNLAAGAHLGYTAEHADYGTPFSTSLSFFEIGPAAMMVFDAQKGGLVPYGLASLGISELRATGANDSGLYAIFQAGALFFLTDKWSLDAYIRHASEDVAATHLQILTLGVGLAVLFDDAKE